MTTEEMIEVMKAYTEGKDIEYRATKNGPWCKAVPRWDWKNFEYRVKPESSYRPYKNLEEMLEDIKKCLDENYGGMQHPVFSGMWLKHKDCEVEEMIAGVDSVKSEILLGKNWTKLSIVFNHFTYLDGTPFGIKE